MVMQAAGHLKTARESLEKTESFAEFADALGSREHYGNRTHVLGLNFARGDAHARKPFEFQKQIHQFHRVDHAR